MTMKHCIYALIICFVISLNACSKKKSNNDRLIKDNYKEKTDWERDGLKGKVKRVIIDDNIKDEIAEYNQYGFRTKATCVFLWSGISDIVFGDFIYKYDSLGRLIQSTCSDFVAIDDCSSTLFNNVKGGKEKGWYIAKDDNGNEIVDNFFGVLSLFDIGTSLSLQMIH